jgi:ubiquitin-protein ligase
MMGWLPSAGGVFRLELFLPEEYPMASPKVSMHDAAVCRPCPGVPVAEWR